MPEDTLEVEEVPEASASTSQESFHKYYLPARMENVTPINVPTNGKYSLPKSLVLPGVNIEGEMLGKVVGLKFTDHDITDEDKFP